MKENRLLSCDTVSRLNYFGEAVLGACRFLSES